MWNKKPYQNVSECHRPCGEGGWEYTLCIRINGRRFFIHMAESNFVNSPSRLEEASERMALFLDGYDDEDEDEDEDGYGTPALTDEEKKAKEEAHRAGVEITNRFNDWAVAPFLDVFQSLAPQPADITTLTMAHVYHQDSFECELRAVDDKLVPGAVTKRDSKGQEIDIWNDGEFACPLPPTTFPVFQLDQVEVHSFWWDRSQDLQLVAENEFSVVGDRDLCFVRPPWPASKKAEPLIRMHEKLASARFGAPEVRIQNLFGVVVDGAGNVFGFLVDRIPQHFGLWYDRDSEKPVAVRERWMRQIETTVEALHSLGFCWGSPDHYSVAIDKNDDMWLVDFDPVSDSEFVGSDSPSRENDLRGIEKIRKGLGLSACEQTSKL